MTVASELDKIQAKLHDDGAIWSREELLRYFNDGYRQLLSKSKGVTRFAIYDVPGRHSFSHSYEWEDRYFTGTSWMAFLPTLNATRRTTYLWEGELLDGITPTASLAGITQQWERAYGPETDRHFVFGLPKDSDRLRRVAWNDQLLLPVSVREFDETDDAWMRRVGEPNWWTPGVDRLKSIEIYEIRTDYQQGYALELFDFGIPRKFNGRTYSVTVAKDYPTNSYAYTNSGEVSALNGIHMDFAPSSAYSSNADSAFSPTPAYNFTINYTRNIPGLEYTFTQPWEYAYTNGDPQAVGETRGMWPWERLDPAGNFQSSTPTANIRPVIIGMGMRLTKAATDSNSRFATQSWEVDQLEGKTTLSTGAIVGSYAWEEAFSVPRILFGVGTIRSMLSDDRQYLSLATHVPYGGVRDLRSSVSGLTVLEVVIRPPVLIELDSPEMVPVQLLKYIRYYVLAQAQARLGEGSNPALSEHYMKRYSRGVALLTRLSDTAHRDRLYVREEVRETAARPPQVRLPSTFEQVR